MSPDCKSIGKSGAHRPSRDASQTLVGDAISLVHHGAVKHCTVIGNRKCKLGWDKSIVSKRHAGQLIPRNWFGDTESPYT